MSMLAASAATFTTTSTFLHLIFILFYLLIITQTFQSLKKVNELKKEFFQILIFYFD
jgi:hypothetical protein